VHAAGDALAVQLEAAAAAVAGIAAAGGLRQGAYRAALQRRLQRRTPLQFVVVAGRRRAAAVQAQADALRRNARQAPVYRHVGRACPDKRRVQLPEFHCLLLVLGHFISACLDYLQMRSGLKCKNMTPALRSAFLIAKFSILTAAETQRAIHPFSMQPDGYSTPGGSGWRVDRSRLSPTAALGTASPRCEPGPLAEAAEREAEPADARESSEDALLAPPPLAAWQTK